jgi:hypothetical protein
VRPLRQFQYTLQQTREVEHVPAEFWAHCAAGGRGCQGATSQTTALFFRF